MLFNLLEILGVRHPFYRLFSTWNAVFEEGNELGRRLLKELSNFVPLKRVTQQTSRRMLLSFKTFIKEFLTEKDSWFLALPALRPQVQHCDVCSSDWDYIVKLETWAEDFEVSALEKRLLSSCGGNGFRIYPAWEVAREKSRNVTFKF